MPITEATVVQSVSNLLACTVAPAPAAHGARHACGLPFGRRSCEGAVGAWHARRQPHWERPLPGYPGMSVTVCVCEYPWACGARGVGAGRLLPAECALVRARSRALDALAL